MQRLKLLYISIGILIAFTGIGLMIIAASPSLADGIFIPFVTGDSGNVTSSSIDDLADEVSEKTNLDSSLKLLINTPTPDMTGVEIDPNIEATPAPRIPSYETVDLAPEIPKNNKYFLLVDNNGKQTAYLVPESMLAAHLEKVGGKYLVLNAPASNLITEREARARALEYYSSTYVIESSIPLTRGPLSGTVALSDTIIVDISDEVPPPVDGLEQLSNQ